MGSFIDERVIWAVSAIILMVALVEVARRWRHPFRDRNRSLSRFVTRETVGLLCGIKKRPEFDELFGFAVRVQVHSMASRLRLWFYLALCVIALGACSQYSTRVTVVVNAPSPQVSTLSPQVSAPSSGYLIERSDWVLRVKDELMTRNLDVPSSGLLVEFNGREIFVASGSKVLVWRCGDQWRYKGVFVDGSRFPAPELTPWCPA